MNRRFLSIVNMTDSSAAAQGQRQLVVSLARCTPQQATSRRHVNPPTSGMTDHVLFVHSHFLHSLSHNKPKILEPFTSADASAAPQPTTQFRSDGTFFFNDHSQTLRSTSSQSLIVDWRKCGVAVGTMQSTAGIITQLQRWLQGGVKGVDCIRWIDGDRRHNQRADPGELADAQRTLLPKSPCKIAA